MVDGWAGLRYGWGNFYASKSFDDPSKNRRVIWAITHESSTQEEYVKRGWAGILVCTFLPFVILVGF